MSGGEVVACRQCGGYKVKVRSRLWLTYRGRSKVTLLITLLTVTLMVAFKLRRCFSTHKHLHQRTASLHYDRTLPLVFVGGVPGSGSSLLRVHLDAHPDIRCNSETRIIPRVLRMYHHWLTDRKEHARLEEAGVSTEVLESAVSAMLLEVLVLSGDAAPRLCSQDPLSLHHARYLSQLFPNSKFLWVVRDGRALVHSLISRQIDARGWNVNNMDWNTKENLNNVSSLMLEQWNNATLSMMDECRRVGHVRCKAVYFEQLLLKPRRVLQRIMEFLNVSWDNNVLQSGTLRTSRYSQPWAEENTPLPRNSLTRWEDEFPLEVLRDAPRIAPALSQLGYDPTELHPDYLRLETTHLVSMFIDVDHT